MLLVLDSLMNDQMPFDSRVNSNAAYAARRVLLFNHPQNG